MKIQATGELREKAALVLVLAGKEKVDKHPLLARLSEKDRGYFRMARSRLSVTSESVHIVPLPSGRHVIALGAGERTKLTFRKMILLARRSVAVARAERLPLIQVALHDLLPPGERGNDGFYETIAVQFEIANFEFTDYKTPPKEGWSFVQKIFVLVEKDPPAVSKALARGAVIGEEINRARALSNMPGGDMTPARLAEAAKKAGRAARFRVTAFDERKIRSLGMGGILGVARGSVEKPRFIVMEYLKGKRSEQPVVLVGKGVTFDTGGLNLKPEQGIYEMHMDMSGGAAVVHTIAALARLGVKKNVVGLVPAVENMPSGSSYHPGDLLKTMSGKTIEVLNTDAEGRIILADALTYARRYKPRLIVDVATLTGAAAAALGQRASAVFTTNQELEAAFREMGEKTGDFVWPLPLWEEFESEIKGGFGDVANIGKTRYGGAITGAVFLWQFVKDYPWVHIDIAPRMTTIEGEYLAKGAAGASIALLVRFLRHYN